jgi:hypothetical protein
MWNFGKPNKEKVVGGEVGVKDYRCPGPKFEAWRDQANRIMNRLDQLGHKSFWSAREVGLKGRIWCATCKEEWKLEDFDQIEMDLDERLKHE